MIAKVLRPVCTAGGLVLAVAWALLATESDARACSCAPLPIISVRPDSVVPTNARIVIDRPYGPPDARLLVQTDHGTTLQLPAIVGEHSFNTRFTFAPELEPETDYTLALVSADGKQLLEEIGAVRTSGGPDRERPTLAGIEDATFKPGQPSDSSCGDIPDRVALRLGKVADRGPDAANLRIALWVAAGDAPIDYAQQPYIVNRGQVFAVSFGGRQCTPEPPVPPGRTMRVGVKIIDAAGNESDAVELVVSKGEPLLWRLGFAGRTIIPCVLGIVVLLVTFVFGPRRTRCRLVYLLRRDAPWPEIQGALTADIRRARRRKQFAIAYGALVASMIATFGYALLLPNFSAGFATVTGVSLAAALAISLNQFRLGMWNRRELWSIKDQLIQHRGETSRDELILSWSDAWGLRKIPQARTL